MNHPCNDLTMDVEDLQPGVRILLVEDESFVREVTSEILQSAGFRVWTAKNAEEAEQIFEQHGAEIELLLTDVILPGETGDVMAESMRRENPWLRVLFVTGYAEQVRALEEAGEELLVKPFSSEALLGSVSSLLGREKSHCQEHGVMQACAGA